MRFDFDPLNAMNGQPKTTKKKPYNHKHTQICVHTRYKQSR